MTSSTYDGEEVLDLVDANDIVVRKISREEFDSHYYDDSVKDLNFLRASVGLVQNSRGQLWIPRRTLQKKLLPGALDFSVAEHIGTGETYEQAIVRGFKEELNLDLNQSDLIYLGKLDPFKDSLYFCAVYVYKTDNVPDYNPEDYSGYEWMYPEEVVASVMGGQSAKTALCPCIETFIKALD